MFFPIPEDAHLLGSPTYQFFLIAILAFCGVGVFMAVSVAIILYDCRVFYMVTLYYDFYILEDAHLLGSPTYQFFLIAILAFCGVGVFMAVSVAIIYLVRKIKHDDRRRNTIELENNAELGMYYYQCSDYSSDNCSTYTSHSQLSEDGYTGARGLFSDDDALPMVGAGSLVQPPQQCLVYNRLSSNPSSYNGSTKEDSAAPFSMTNHSRVYDSTTCHPPYESTSCHPPYESTTCHPQPTDPLRYGTFHGVDNQCFADSEQPHSGSQPHPGNQEPHSEVYAPMDKHGLLKTKKKDKRPVSK